MSNGEWFSWLCDIDYESLSADDRAFFDSHKLGNRRKEHGFTKEEKYWISEIRENGVAAEPITKTNRG